MPRFNRRAFLSTAGGAGLWSLCRRLEAAGQPAAAGRGAIASSLKITDISRHEILLPFHDFNALALQRYHGLGVQLRTIYVVKTNQGLEGYGEAWGRGPPEDELKKYVGTSPFDWIGDTTTLPINMALYDLMESSSIFPPGN